ncbi:hypothetical protein LJC45_02955 [Alistipes sp. OttesenSCG-928-B03]|nr:hypothetical protein [Alistipes sp. OttesenSCG-928-B03]
MANLKTLKKDIDYLVEEILSDCYLTIFFHPDKKDKVLVIMQRAVDMRNDLFQRANNSPEKHNPSLNRKHFMQIRRDMFTGIDGLFNELSALTQGK